MTSSNPSLTRFLISLIALVFTLPVCADHHIDVEYAEQQPLAPHSLLLDMTRFNNSFIAVGERGHIMISSDGATWKQAEHVPTRSTLTTVFARGNRIWAGGHDATVLTSGDGGKTWSRLFYDPDRQQAVMDIYFTDENNGVAIGSYGLYLYTSDGGKSWQESIVDEESDFHLNSLVDMGEGKWLIAGEAGYSYRSYDYGQSWEPLEIPYQGSMWGALQSGDECVIFFGLRGHVLESCDFGTSWTEVETGSEASVSGAARHEATILLAANSGTLMIRDDSGRFSVYHHSSGVDFSSVISLGDGNFLLAGEDGTHHYPEVKR